MQIMITLMLEIEIKKLNYLIKFKMPENLYKKIYKLKNCK